MPFDAPDQLDLSRTIQETWIERVHYYETVESTNTTALEWARENEPGGVELFIAERQSGGRGRGSNVWWSAPGALTFSLLTVPFDLPPEQLPRVSLTVGLAICKTVERFAERFGVALKWPNDVYLAERKVAGILIELAASMPKRLVIGIGLNVNNLARDAPCELRSTAISLRDTLPEAGLFDRTEVLIECLRQVEGQLERLLSGDQSLPGDWQDYSLLNGQQVRVVTPGHEIAGLCESIADDGALIV
ncbi:MAG: biotin--[acetyl-CoA-carboxylase] ligase, partial [Aeoliella sp.]